jgi:hypothetical protein
MKNLFEKSGRKTPLGRPRHRWENHIKMDSKRKNCEGVGWFKLAWEGKQWRTYVKKV